MMRALDPVSSQTCRRLLVGVALVILWAKALSPQAVWGGTALLASGCAMVTAGLAVFRHEPLFGPSLNRWDEAAALVGMRCLARQLI